jgi:hypothetical protein
MEKQRASIRRILFFIGLAILVISQISVYAITGQWIGILCAIGLGFLWLFARKNPGTWLPNICLATSLVLTATGTLTGSHFILSIIGSGFSLAIWDLLLFDASLQKTTYADQTRLYENTHLKSLSLAVGLGIFTGIIGHSLHLQTPFFLIILMIVLALFGLDRVWLSIKRLH